MCFRHLLLSAVSLALLPFAGAAFAETAANGSATQPANSAKQPPADPNIQQVPDIVNDSSCPSGRRNVVYVYVNGAYSTTKRLRCNI